MKGILLFGHGARNPEYSAPFERIRARIAASQPDLAVEIGFLELTAPPLEESIGRLAARGVRRIKVVPIFFAPGRHVLKDLPERIGEAEKRFPGLKLETLACVGEVEGVIEAMALHALNA